VGSVRVEGTGSVTPRRAILRGVDRELASCDFTVVEEPDRLGGLGLGAELDEGKSPGTPRFAVCGQVHLDGLARL